jgi:hypothetical protein
MISGFDVKDQALGTGDTLAYTFDFKIYDPTDLLIWVQDGSGNVVEQVRGDDTTYLAGLAFDSLNGGGTVTLAAFLPDTYVITFMLAPDAPDQPSDFPDKGSFSLSALEGALDFLASCIQRVSWLATRAAVMHDLDDLSSFDPTLPLGIGNNPGGVVSVKADGSGFEIIITTATIAAAQGYASTAQAAQNAAASSATAAAASATAAAASAAASQSGVTPFGTPAAPENVLAANGVTFTPANQEEVHWIQGNAGNVVVTANPQINTAGVAKGQRIYLYGANDAQTVKFTNGNGLSLNGDCILGQEDCLGLLFNGTQWSELFRRSAT